MIELIVISIAAVAVGALSLTGELGRARQPQDWCHVTGRITACELTGRGGVRLEYQYTVQGELYSGSSSLSGAGTRGGSAAEELRNLYRVGCPLRITYDPQRPWQSQLDDAGHRQFRPDALLVSLVVMLVGILSLVGLLLDAVAR